MISKDFCQNLKYLRENSWDYTKLKLFQPRIPQNFYEKLLIDLLLECEQRKFLKNTGSIAKTFFDLAVTQFPHLNEDNAGFYLVAALQTAVQASQSPQISDQCTIDFAIRYANSPFQLKKIMLAQLQIGRIVESKLRIFTPYDYIEFFELILQHYDNEGIRKQMVIQLIDLAISLPSLMLRPQEDIFMACFLVVFQKQMSASDLNMIRRTISYKNVVCIQRTLKDSLKELQQA